MSPETTARCTTLSTLSRARMRFCKRISLLRILLSSLPKHRERRLRRRSALACTLREKKDTN
eukprot:7904164-Alexandrium_andersonii.AAC.1